MTRWFNGGTQPLVPVDNDGRPKWGGGVIMPGEYMDTDARMGPPWITDPEAEQQSRNVSPSAPSDNPDGGSVQAAATEAASVAENAPQAPSDVVAPESPAEGPAVHVNADGEVVNDAGQVVGHIEPAGSQPNAGTNTGGNA